MGIGLLRYAPYITAIYGSIGVIIALLVWMDWSMIAMLMGAVFNVALKETYDKPKEMEIEIEI